MIKKLTDLERKIVEEELELLKNGHIMITDTNDSYLTNEGLYNFIYLLNKKMNLFLVDDLVKIHNEINNESHEIHSSDDLIINQLFEFNNILYKFIKTDDDKYILIEDKPIFQSQLDKTKNIKEMSKDEKILNIYRVFTKLFMKIYQNDKNCICYLSKNTVKLFFLKIQENFKFFTDEEYNNILKNINSINYINKILESKNIYWRFKIRLTYKDTLYIVEPYINISENVN